MIFNNRYELKNLIGKRRFGIVYKVLDNESNKFYALKFISNKIGNKDIGFFSMN